MTKYSTELSEVYVRNRGIARLFFNTLFKFFLHSLSAPAITVGETEGAMDSASVLVFTYSFAYNFVRK